MNLQDIFLRAMSGGWALPHFNISNLEMLKAIAMAAEEKRSPVLVGVSEGEREFIGLEQCVALVRIFKEQYAVPLFLNADHTHDVALAKKAVDAGFDSVHIDLSKKPLEENRRGTKEVVEYARAKNPDISIEGEIGYLVTDSSKIYKEAIEVPKESLANPEEAHAFVEFTGVNRLAPAVGSIHGIAANVPHLDLPRIEELRRALSQDVALVLHGGSGVPRDQISEAVKRRVTNIHISTDLRIAYVEALKGELAKGELAAYKFAAPAIEAVKRVCMENMDLFGSSGKV